MRKLAASSFACPASSGEPSPFAAISARKTANSPETLDCSRRSSRRCRLARIFTTISRACPVSFRSISRTSASAALSSVSETFFSNFKRLVTGKRWEMPISTLPSRNPEFCSNPDSNSGLLRRPDWFMRPSASWMRRRAAARSGFCARIRPPRLASETTTADSAWSRWAMRAQANMAVKHDLYME